MFSSQKPAVLPVLAMFNSNLSAFATTHSHKSPTRSRFDCDRLDTIYIELSALVVSEYALANTHFVTLKEFVSSLFQRIGLVFELATELWRSLIISIKEFLIAKVYTLNHILQCL